AVSTAAHPGDNRFWSSNRKRQLPCTPNRYSPVSDLSATPRAPTFRSQDSNHRLMAFFAFRQLAGYPQAPCFAAAPMLPDWKNPSGFGMVNS
ncbi:MAG: hypothetical protein ACLP02_18385, partial [Rhodomicrobium sp.]